MPAHSHNASTNNVNISGGFVPFNNDWDGGGLIGSPWGVFSMSSRGGTSTHISTSDQWKDTMQVNFNSNHTHSVSINNTGSDGTHNNMQPYLSVYMWKRTA